MLRTNDRIEVIDVLRGFTLLGIALVHFTEQYYAGMTPEAHPIGGMGIPDQVVRAFVGIFISGKFFMIFSFLFGLSFFIQLSKSDGSASFVVRFLWRLIILFFIGLIHQINYRGDILTVYAVLGVGLLISYRLPDKVLLIIALLLVFNVPSMVTRAIESFQPVKEGASFFNMDQKTLQLYYDTVKSGSYREILIANFKDLSSKVEFQVMSGRIYITMGLFLLGLYAGRKNVFDNVDLFKKLRRYSLWTFLATVLVLTSFFGGAELLKIKLPEIVQWLIGGAGMDVANACLATIYVSIIVTLFQKDHWKNRLMVFYSAGRMGLTTYLMQALIGIFIFFSPGLGLLGEVGAGICFLIALVVFVFQIVFANFWLSYFQYGPVEWLWRSLTYLRLQPLLKAKQQE